MTLSNPEMPALERADVILALPGGREAAKMWMDGCDPKLPILSPLYGDLSGFPPVRVFFGTHELLLPDNRLFKEKMRAAGGDIQLYEYTGGFHVFVGSPALPESQDAYEKVQRAIRELVKNKSSRFA